MKTAKIDEGQHPPESIFIPEVDVSRNWAWSIIDQFQLRKLGAESLCPLSRALCISSWIQDKTPLKQMWSTYLGACFRKTKSNPLMLPSLCAFSFWYCCCSKAMPPGFLANFVLGCLNLLCLSLSPSLDSMTQNSCLHQWLHLFENFQEQ